MKKILVTAFLLILLITISEIASTYSLFETNNNIVVNEDVGKWNIKVNNSLINENASFVVDNFVVSENTEVQTGKFYPGGTMYFDIIIEPNECDVSFRYDIMVNRELLVGEQFKITSITELSGQELTKTGKDVYSEIITLDEVNEGTERVIRISVLWEDDEIYNYTDSLIGMEIVDFEIPINIRFVQYLGEDLEVYTGVE